tara:strand:+ start:665 stop:1063 length:399 start_codon:yes stop_codon:yes gene_type:complete
MIDKLLRPFVCDQLKALMEKLETQEFDTRSLARIGNFLDELRLTRFERYVVSRVYKRVRRLHDLNRIIEEIIIGQGQYDINMDINAKLRASMDSGVYTGAMAAQQNAMWNGTAPPTTVTQARRVVARPKTPA